MRNISQRQGGEQAEAGDSSAAVAAEAAGRDPFIPAAAFLQHACTPVFSIHPLAFWCYVGSPGAGMRPPVTAAQRP
eukprot:361095-Chlamydomonas_euryale.AAC.23